VSQAWNFHPDDFSIKFHCNRVQSGATYLGMIRALRKCSGTLCEEIGAGNERVAANNISPAATPRNRRLPKYVMLSPETLVPFVFDDVGQKIVL
jgi:hypothetical protein